MAPACHMCAEMVQDPHLRGAAHRCAEKHAGKGPVVKTVISQRAAKAGDVECNPG